MKETIYRAYNTLLNRGWDKLYWAVDIHDTCMEANYIPGQLPTTFLSISKRVLQHISKRKDAVLILYTCSHPHEIEQYVKFFKENDINFKFSNKNPDVGNTRLGSYDDKFYFNVLLEDKAGFNPDTHWYEIEKALSTIDKASVKVEITKVSNDSYWYKKSIGKKFYVAPYKVEDGKYWASLVGGLHINANDCKIIE